MQAALLFILLPFVVLVAGGALIALNALRNAPEGHETQDGFQFGSEREPARIHTLGSATNLAA